EAVELAKRFGTDESGKFVNGVLGKIVREIEPCGNENDRQCQV
ncbi:MAG TPA: transcription antitermination factor NusB, partial [Synergistales bacterium]|nr:transcription antitermination factor NusB [Synergistales bacterium]